MDATELMMEHSNSGTFHLLDSASHFFMTRLMCQATDSPPTEAVYNQLVEEAWCLFVLPAIQSYHTWLKDVLPPSSELDDAVDQILVTLRSDWTESLMELKASMLEDLA